MRRLDLLRMLERLFGFEELPDEMDEPGTTEVEIVGDGAAEQVEVGGKQRVERIYWAVTRRCSEL